MIDPFFLLAVFFGIHPAAELLSVRHFQACATPVNDDNDNDADGPSDDLGLNASHRIKVPETVATLTNDMTLDLLLLHPHPITPGPTHSRHFKPNQTKPSPASVRQTRLIDDP